MLKSLVLVLTAAVVGATGCAERDNGVLRVEILPSIATRVTGVHFDSGDQIGLSITKGSSPYIENRAMTYDGSAFTAEGLLWYNDQNQKSTLTAYHPYSSSGAPGDIAVAADQTTGYAQSDLLGARKAEVTPGAAPVGMVFRHLLSEVRILVTNNVSAAVTGIAVGGSVPAAEVDLSSLSVRVRAGVSAAEIQANEVTPNAAYRVIVVPQTATLTLTVYTADGKSRSKQLASALLDSGKCYDVAVAVNNTDISVSLSGDVEDWIDGGSLGGDEAPDPGPSPDPNPGLDGTLDYGGVTYRTRTISGRIWMADNLRYLPAGVSMESGVWYSADGASVLTTQGLLYNYATATGGASTATTPVQGICPAGWHIPTVDELLLLKEGNYGSDFFVPAGCRAATGDVVGQSSQIGCLMAAPLNANGKCDCLTYGTESPVPTMGTRLSGFGISVRCVKNV